MVCYAVEISDKLDIRAHRIISVLAKDFVACANEAARNLAGDEKVFSLVSPHEILIDGKLSLSGAPDHTLRDFEMSWNFLNNGVEFGGKKYQHVGAVGEKEAIAFVVREHPEAVVYYINDQGPLVFGEMK